MTALAFLLLSIALMAVGAVLGAATVRSILNRAFFTKLYVDGTKIVDHQLSEPFDVLAEAYTIWWQRQTRPRTVRPPGSASDAGRGTDSQRPRIPDGTRGREPCNHDRLVLRGRGLE